MLSVEIDFIPENVINHYILLYPHSINIPFITDSPDKWKTQEQTIEAPVSIASVGYALIDVAAGKVKITQQLVDAIFDRSQDSNGTVPACVDDST